MKLFSQELQRAYRQNFELFKVLLGINLVVLKLLLVGAQLILFNH